jgi:hypothetical protein
MILIGIGGKARAGKDTMAQAMLDLYPDKVKLYSFAAELKKYCAEHHDELLPKWQLAHQTKQHPICKEDPIYGYTAILQWWGTDVMRKQDPDYWVKQLANRITQDDPAIAVITDVRFPNEANWVKEKGGTLIRVRRLEPDGTLYLDPSRDPKHISETSLENYDSWTYDISAQSGDVKNLQTWARAILEYAIDFADIQDDGPAEAYFSAYFSEYGRDGIVLTEHPDSDPTGFYN